MWCGKKFHGLSKKKIPCHEILCDVAEYFAMSLNNVHVAEKINIKNIPWHGMEYALQFLSCSFEQARLLMLACLPINVVTNGTFS